jgi:hypothetical protein
MMYWRRGRKGGKEVKEVEVWGHMNRGTSTSTRSRFSMNMKAKAKATGKGKGKGKIGAREQHSQTLQRQCKCQVGK